MSSVIDRLKVFVHFKTTAGTEKRESVVRYTTIDSEKLKIRSRHVISHKYDRVGRRGRTVLDVCSLPDELFYGCDN